MVFSDFESGKRARYPMRVLTFEKSQITPMQTETFLAKIGVFLTEQKNRRFLKNMITGIKKTHKTTEIYFDEADNWTTVITYNTSLKNRLLAFSQEYPELCKIVSDDECGCLQFKIQKPKAVLYLSHIRAVLRRTQGKSEGEDARTQC